MTREGTTYNNYIADAKKLNRIRNELLEMFIRIANETTKQNKVSLKLRRTYENIDQIRSLHEDNFARDFPDTWEINVFYPGPNKKKECDNGHY